MVQADIILENSTRTIWNANMSDLTIPWVLKDITSGVSNLAGMIDWQMIILWILVTEIIYLAIMGLRKAKYKSELVEYKIYALIVGAACIWLLPTLNYAGMLNGILCFVILIVAGALLVGIVVTAIYYYFRLNYKMGLSLNEHLIRRRKRRR